MYFYDKNENTIMKLHIIFNFIEEIFVFLRKKIFYVTENCLHEIKKNIFSSESTNKKRNIRKNI